jgi:hypothetical protein
MSCAQWHSVQTMVVFEVAGSTWPLDDRTAETLAVALRVGATAPGDPAGPACVPLADAIEAALVAAAAQPIAVDEDGAEALFRQLNAMLRNPDAVDPAYGLYLELRRFLGRLYA